MNIKLKGKYVVRGDLENSVVERKFFENKTLKIKLVRTSHWEKGEFVVSPQSEDEVEALSVSADMAAGIEFDDFKMWVPEVLTEETDVEWTSNELTEDDIEGIEEEAEDHGMDVESFIESKMGYELTAAKFFIEGKVIVDV